MDLATLCSFPDSKLGIEDKDMPVRLIDELLLWLDTSDGLQVLCSRRKTKCLSNFRHTAQRR